jgi:aryl-alcohol dehydrogenase-like predicted oxidoreductase
LTPTKGAGIRHLLPGEKRPGFTMETVLPVTRELGISVTAYGVFSRGLLSSETKVPDLSKGDYRAHYPGFKGRTFNRIFG